MQLIFILLFGCVNNAVALIVFEAFFCINKILIVIVVALVATALGGRPVRWSAVLPELVLVD